MPYGFWVTLHLLAAIAFAGTVFFEVVILGSIGRKLPARTMLPVEQALGTRAVAVMPWVLLLLYAAGLAMAWQHRTLLAQPLTSSLGLLLSIKMLLAFSVFGHFMAAMLWRRRGQLHVRRSRRLHLSIFCHVLAIAVLAKAMFYVSW